jgi:hypothetical protein
MEKVKLPDQRYCISSIAKCSSVLSIQKLKQEKSKFPTVMKIDRVLVGDNIGKK